ncbi:MAG: leucine-rich repeat domain-containing protein [Ruminococcaceae bacterium]|nr:leucine-rich repeat domain-containing protein [Oscillospiraceae bacterium]
MGNSTKLLSLILVIILLLSATFLISCQKPVFEDETESETVETIVDTQPKRQVIKTEVIDGRIWVTYSDDPENPVDIGALEVEDAHLGISLNYMPLADGNCGITAGNARYLEEIIIPDTYDGKPVTSILDNAFNGGTYLKKISIPDSITSVGENAFYGCEKLEYNEYDNALYLGNENNPYLILVKTKNSAITRCTVNEKTVAICNNAFEGCSQLETLSIPNTVKSIGSKAFYGCDAVQEINVPEGVSYIGMETFRGCKSLKKIAIPSTVTNIGSSAFFGCTSLETVTFAANSTLAGIENAAFYNCKKIKEINIPKSVIYIGDDKTYNKTADSVFNGCDSLEKVTFEEGSKLEKIGNYVFSGCTKLSSITLPDTLTYLGTSSFTSTAITAITIPNGVTNIGEKAFYGCASLKTVTLGSNLNKISKEAFAGCEDLNNLIIPESVTTISKGAFANCNSLTSVTFKNVKNWHNYAKQELIDSAILSDPKTAAQLVLDAAYTTDLMVG